MSEHPPVDVLGLGAALPGPGWTVLDAAREQRFTGELIADAEAVVRVYFDRGRIYVAERSTDPPLGTRLVEAGALNRAQLDYGTLRVGEIEHLGRLFDRVPSVNRDGVLVMNELMTEECVRWLAGQQVTAVTATPYRHHASGMHRWEIFEPAGAVGSSAAVPEMAFPAPDPSSSPVIAAETVGGPPSPDPLSATPLHDHRVPSTIEDLFLDDLVTWDEPSPFRPAAPIAVAPSGRLAVTNLLTETTEAWIDGLDADGVATASVETLQRLTPLPVRPVDDFQLIWPSGEKDDVADATADQADADRIGPTARVDREPFEAPSGDPAEGLGRPGEHDAGPSPLAVRRAVATIDTGSLEARRRLIESSSDVTAPPWRVAAQRDSNVWRNDAEHPVPSVFDTLPTPIDTSPSATAAPSVDHEGRVSALRRLIGSLRRA